MEEKDEDFICIGMDNPTARPHSKQIRTKSKWFEIGSYILVDVEEDCIRFSKPSLDYNGDMFKVTKQGEYFRKITITADLPILKNLYFDKEESNEDEKVVYFK